MKLHVKNFNLVKEAQLSLNGLTVIAGDNDTGKTTIGKLLFSIIKAHELVSADQKEYDIEKRLPKVLSHVFEQADFNQAELLLKKGNAEFNVIGKSSEKMEIKGNMKGFHLEDIIYIESPIVFMLLDYFTRLSQENEKADLNEIKYMYLLRDVYEKLLRKSNITIEDENLYKHLLSNISEIIDGGIIVDKGQFLFERKNDGMKFPIGGVASGVQSFAMLDVLTRNHHIHNKSVLIIDEPEIHLHPKWEYEYAKLITEFVKLGVHVVVTTHSMYMVKALKEFTRDIPEKVNFYLTDKNSENQVIYEDVTLEVFKIFKKFSEPLQSLVWRKP